LNPNASLRLIASSAPRVAVTPHIWTQDRFVSELDRVIAHRLPGEVVRDRGHLGIQ